MLGPSSSPVEATSSSMGEMPKDAGFERRPCRLQPLRVTSLEPRCVINQSLGVFWDFGFKRPRCIKKDAVAAVRGRWCRVFVFVTMDRGTYFDFVIFVGVGCFITACPRHFLRGSKRYEDEAQLPGSGVVRIVGGCTVRGVRIGMRMRFGCCDESVVWVQIHCSRGSKRYEDKIRLFVMSPWCGCRFTARGDQRDTRMRLACRGRESWCRASVFRRHGLRKLFRYCHLRRRRRFLRHCLRRSNRYEDGTRLPRLRVLGVVGRCLPVSSSALPSAVF